MNRSFDKFRTILFLSLSLAAINLLTTGCRSMGVAVAQPVQPTTIEAAPTNVPDEYDLMVEGNVKALESFLARTESYSLAPAGAPMPAPENSQLMRPVESPPAPAQRQQAAPQPFETPTTKAAIAPPRVVYASISEPTPAPATMPQAVETLTVPTRSYQKMPSAAPMVKNISIRESVADDVVVSNSPPAVQVNQPAQRAKEATSRTMDDLLEKMVERAVSGQDVSAAWEAGMIHAALRKPLDAGSISHALSHGVKPLFLSTIDLIRSLRKVMEENPSDVSDTLDQLETLHRMIAVQADPSVDAIAMCRQVTTFGVFEEMSMSEFVTGRATPTIIYSELENLSAKMDADGSYRTELATRIEVFTSDGQSILSREEPRIVDRCRQHRRDFFIAQRITLPATMQPGDYVLKVYVEDKLAGRAAEGSHPFTVGTRTASIRN